MVYLVSSTDYVTPVTGATLAVTLSKAGGAFASISPTVTDRGNGWYSVVLTSAHTDTLGDFVLRITASGADSIDLREEVFALLPGENVTVGTVASGAITAASFAAGAINATVAPNLDAAITTRLAAAGYTAPSNADIATILTRTDVATSTRLATAGYTAPPSAVDIRTEIDTNSTKLDVTVGSRLATAGYTAPANADIATILTRTDVATSTRLSAASYTVPDNASITAIRSTTDQFTFTVANRADVNVRLMNSAAVLGNGTAGDLWRG